MFFKAFQLFTFCTLIASCAPNREEAPFNTELFCSTFSYRFLILKTTKEEVLKSIEKAIEYKIKSNKRTKYTVLYFPHNQSTSIYNITPEELRSCQIRELPRKGFRWAK